VEGDSLLKNPLSVRFHPRSEIKHSDFGVFRARFTVAMGLMPTFSTSWGILRTSPFTVSANFAMKLSEKGLSNAPKVDSAGILGPKWAE